RFGLPASIPTHAIGRRESPARVAGLAKRVPDTTIVVLGALSSLRQEWELRSIADECPNVLFDTTMTLPIGPIERFVDVVGSDRVVFGTDMYLDAIWAFERPPVLANVLH